MDSIGLKAVLDDSNFQAGLRRYESGISQMTKITDNAAAAISGAFKVGAGLAVAGIGAITAAAKIGLDTALEYGEQLNNLGDMFGIGAKQADVFATAFTHFGVPLEEATQQINFFTRGLAETVKVGKDGKQTLTPFGEALQKLGVKAFDAKGKLKTFDQILPQLMDAFAKLPPGVNKSNLAMELFGARGGSKFLDFLSAGNGALKDASKRIDEFGTMTDEQSNALEDFSFAMNDVQDGLKKIWTQIGLKVLPYARKFVDFVNQKILPALAKWTKDNLPKLIAQLQKLGDWIGKNVIPVLERLFTAFQKGGLTGLFSQLLTEIQKAMPTIITELSKLKDRFWEWLTGKGGALEQAGKEMGKVLTVIKTWAESNAPNWITTLDKWKTDFWNWLTDKAKGVVSKVGEELPKVIKAIETWAKDNAPKWATVLEGWKTDFWNWLTADNGAIAQAGQAITDFSTKLKEKVASGDVRTAIEGLGEEIATTVLGFVGDGLTDSKKQTPILVKFAESLGQAFADSAVIADIIGTSFQRGIYIGMLKKAGLSDEEARKVAEVIFPYSVQTKLYLAAQATGKETGKQTGTATLDELEKQITGGTKRTSGALDQLLRDSTQDATPKVESSTSQFGQSIVQQTTNGVTNNTPTLTGGITNSTNTALTTSGGNTAGSAYNVGGGLMNNMAAGVNNNAGALVGAVTTAINAAMSIFWNVMNQIGNAKPKSYATGGPVPTTGPAYLHAGEYVLNRRQVAALAPILNNNNSRTINASFTHNWTGAAGGMNRSEIESIAEQASYRGIRKAMGAA